MRNLKDMNKACLLKLAWKFKSNDKFLWCQFMKGKYARSNHQNTMETKAFDSNIWKNIISICHIPQDNTTWKWKWKWDCLEEL